MVERASRFKITTLKRFSPDEVFDSPSAKGAPENVCRVFEVGPVFRVEADGGMPEEFCS